MLKTKPEKKKKGEQEHTEPDSSHEAEAAQKLRMCKIRFQQLDPGSGPAHTRC